MPLLADPFTAIVTGIKETPELALEGFEKSSLQGRNDRHEPVMPTLAPEYRGASRSSAPRNREDVRMLQKICAWSKRSRYESATRQPPFKVGPDLKGVSPVAAAGRPLKLVPPSNFESRHDAFKKQVFDDTTFLCQWYAEQRADGWEVEYGWEAAKLRLDELAEREAEAARSLERVRALNRKGRPGPCAPPPKCARWGPAPKKKLRQACAFLKPYQKRLAFITLTLSGWCVTRLSLLKNGIGALMSNFRRALMQKAKRAGLEDYYLDVAELQPKRTRREGMPCWHWHCVMVNKFLNLVSADWVLSPEDISELWQSALKVTLGVKELDQTNIVEVKYVKKDVYAYLSKYVSKGTEVSLINWGEWPNMVIKQWVAINKVLRDDIRKITPELPGDFMTWLEMNQKRLKKARLYHLKVWAPDHLPIGNLYEVQFYGVRAFALCVCLWERDRRLLFDMSLRPSLEVPAKYEFDPRSALGIPIPPEELQSNDLRTIGVCNSWAVPDEFRETLEVTFRDVDIAEPVFL